jgi:integrase
MQFNTMYSQHLHKGRMGMSVRKLIVMVKGKPTDFWIADYSDGAGNRHQRRFSRKKEAGAFHQQVKVDIRAGKHVSVSDKVTMADVFEKWVRGVEATRKQRSTIRQYRQHINLHLVPIIGATKLSKLTRAHCENLRDKLLAKMSHVLARKVFVSFKSALKHSHCKHIAEGVMIGASARPDEEFAPGISIPSPDEVRRLLAATTDDQKRNVLLQVATLCGLRASELRALRWIDVDLKAGLVHVRQRADRWNVLGPPKSKKGRRSIPIGSKLVAALRKWKLACPNTEPDLVFPSRAGTIIGHRNFDRLFESAFRDAHVVTKDGKPKYSPHDLRHFFASWCISPIDAGGRGLQAKTVQTWMGHANISITLDIYGHLFQDQTDNAEVKASEAALLG